MPLVPALLTDIVKFFSFLFCKANYLELIFRNGEWANSSGKNVLCILKMYCFNVTRVRLMGMQLIALAYGFSLCLKIVLGTMILGCFPSIQIIHHSCSQAWFSCFGKSLGRDRLKACNQQNLRQRASYTLLVLELSSWQLQWTKGMCYQLPVELGKILLSLLAFWKDKQSIILNAFQVWIGWTFLASL